MKIKILLSLLLTFSIVQFSLAQKSAQLIGYWEYNRLYNTEGMDEKGMQMMQMFLNGTFLHFMDDHQYTGVIMTAEDHGSWRLNDDESAVILTSDKGDEGELSIVSLTDDELTVQVSRASFVMKRKTDAPVAKAKIEEKKIPEMVSATPEAVAGKWYLQRKESSDKTEEQIQMVSELIRGSYYQFDKNGKCKAKVLNITEEGKWSLEDNNRRIVIAVDQVKKIWGIHEISESKMVLFRGNSDELWIFGRTETE